MALWQLEEFADPALLGFIRSLVAPDEYIGDQLLPDRFVDDPDFSYVLGSSKRPVMAQVMGYNATTPLHTQLDSAGVISGNLPLIKRMAGIDEKTIQRFETPRFGTNDVANAVGEVYTQLADLNDTVLARREWLTMQAISTDVLTYNEQGVRFDFNFGFNDAFQIDLVAQTNGAGSALAGAYGPQWLDAAANPVVTLSKLCDTIGVASGRRPGVFVCSTKAAATFAANAAMLAMVRGPGAPTAIMSQQEVDTLFSIYNLPRIVTYDALIGQEQPNGSQVDVRAMAENMGVLLPDGEAVGNFLWGPTAESRKLLGTPLAGARPGVYASAWEVDEPPAAYTKVAACGFPTLPGASYIGQVKLFA